MIEQIKEYFQPIKIYTIDGFDGCCIGYDYNGHVRLIYSVTKMIKQIMDEYEYDELEAIDHLDTILSYLPDDGSHIVAPIICQDNFDNITI